MVIYILEDLSAGIAQLVEQRTENPRVTSSSLVPGKNKIFFYIKAKPEIVDSVAKAPGYKAAKLLVNFVLRVINPTKVSF